MRGEIHTFGFNHLHSLTSSGSLLHALDCLENALSRLYPNHRNTGSEQMTHKWRLVLNAIA